jgi:hypothetical protein
MTSGVIGERWRTRGVYALMIRDSAMSLTGTTGAIVFWAVWTIVTIGNAAHAGLQMIRPHTSEASRGAEDARSDGVRQWPQFTDRPPINVAIWLTIFAVGVVYRMVHGSLG